jgi:GNAT superfamily N-acetyltransferase
MRAVTIRRAEARDARAVAEYALKLFAQHTEYDQRRFAEIASIEGAEKFYASRMKAKDARVFVAEAGGEIVGFAYVEYEALDYSALLERAAWLHDIYINAAARGSNAGTLLIEAAKQAAKEMGADKLMLTVAAQNKVAKAFFERKGFRTTMVEMMFDLTEGK